MPTRLLQTRSYDEKCQFGLTFFSRKRVTIGDNKGRNHSLFMGFYLLFDPFVKERKRMGQSSSNREAATIFFPCRGAKFMW